MSSAAPSTQASKPSRLAACVRDAAASGTALSIIGGGTKQFYGRTCAGERLEVAEHTGIVAYEPSELVITARAGTPVAEIEAELAAHGQILGFEPPVMGPNSTIGGVVSSGLSGPGRPYRGSVRDHLLGVEIINGRGEVLRFGGQVMKNVAGYDVSRLIAGALGVLGVVTEVSLRVVPRGPCEQTLCWVLPAAGAATRMRELSRRPWPITAMAFDGQMLRVRLSGSRLAIDDAVRALGSAATLAEDDFWHDLRHYRFPLFDPRAETGLWRLALPPAAPDPPDYSVILVDWAGAQRWVAGTAMDADALRAYCRAQGGHASRFRGGADGGEVFDELAPALQALMQRVKRAFDPVGILNPGRLYSWL
ncbi:MAG: glycolate oxidase subunit GlcE [Gammaproteobacteria bacterium]